MSSISTPSHSFQWDDGISGTTKHIAETTESPLRVLAGPGTGKTFALMRRIARLLQAENMPEKILVCTFTRTAAEDLERELGRLGIQGVDKIQTGTVHSICFRILLNSDVMSLTQRNPRTLLNFEERILLEDLKALGLGGVTACRDRLEAFKAAWARLQSDIPGWPTDLHDKNFNDGLVSWLKFHRGMLVGEIVPETLRFLRDNPASPFRSYFEHVLVDEYQDLNKAEQSLLDLLASSGTLTIVGDEDQSIYSFKFAHPDGVSTFHETHEGTHDETLTDCRRCPKIVVAMANSLIEHNTRAISRSLVPMEENIDGEVFVAQWPDLDSESQGIARFIKDRVDSGQVVVGKVLILTQRRFWGYALREKLTQLNIQAKSFFTEQALEGNPKVIEQCQSQQAFALLSLLAEPSDLVALRCWCGFGNNSLRSRGWKRLRQHCDASGDSLLEALHRLSAGDLSLPYTNDLTARFNELNARLSSLGALAGDELLEALFPSTETWAEPFRVLASTMNSDELNPQTLREVLFSGISQPELPTEVDFVRIMSLHKSKGLTADLVVVVGCIEGLLPNIDSSLPVNVQNQTLEEQRRLFYVALTRTKKTLLISSATKLPREQAYKLRVPVHGGNKKDVNTIASRFLSQLGPSSPTPVSGNSIFK